MLAQPCPAARACLLPGLLLPCAIAVVLVAPPRVQLPHCSSRCTRLPAAPQIPKDLQKYAKTIVEADGFAQVYPEHKVGGSRSRSSSRRSSSRRVVRVGGFEAPALEGPSLRPARAGRGAGGGGGGILDGRVGNQGGRPRCVGGPFVRWRQFSVPQEVVCGVLALPPDPMWAHVTFLPHVESPTPTPPPNRPPLLRRTTHPLTHRFCPSQPRTHQCLPYPTTPPPIPCST